MKKFILAVSALLSLAMFTGISMADNPSAEMGKQLFNDSALGGSTNGRSCNSCHNNGDGLAHSGNDNNLPETINRCITGPLNGKKLDADSKEMNSLIMYIQSLED